MSKPTILLLGGGPDAEREVSLTGHQAANDALTSLGYSVNAVVIDHPTVAEIHDMKGTVIFPLLHGPFGEGGPLQDLLERDGRPYIGCRPQAARSAMDKIATKAIALAANVPTAAFAILNLKDSVCPMPFPVVAKPVHEGSSVGVHICRTHLEWLKALTAIRSDVKEHPTRVYMVEQFIKARELTQGLIDPSPTSGSPGPRLALVEIKPAVEFYDYNAKYHSDDTKYQVNPELPAGVADTIHGHAMTMARKIGVRHLSRIDFLLVEQNQPWLLEVNTLPGFTGHSLLPMAAADAGIDFAGLCERLVQWAVRDHTALNR